MAQTEEDTMRVGRTFASETKRQAFIVRQVVTLLAAIGGVVAMGTTALASHVTCGMIVTENLVLDADLSCTGRGLTVGADGITIDLHGHTLFGDGTDAGIVNSGGFDDVVITNGVLDGFTTGVVLQSLSGVISYNLVSRLEIRNSFQAAGPGAGYGIVVQFADHVTISRNNIHDNELTGILLDSTFDSSLSRNTLSNSEFGSGINLV